MAFLFFINFSKNEAELKLENPKYTSREMNSVLQPIESQSKKKNCDKFILFEGNFLLFVFYLNIYCIE